MAEYSIISCIRKDKPIKRNGKYPIYFRIRVGVKETKVSTNLDIMKEQWDDKKKAPKDRALLILLNRKRMELELYIHRILVEVDLPTYFGQKVKLHLNFWFFGH